MTDAWELLVDFGLLVLIWIVQAIIYPGFRHLESRDFIRVHSWYARNISFIVVPLMTAQLAMKGMRALHDTQAMTLAALAMVLLCWAATFLLAVPCHRALCTRGKDPAVIDRLVRFNWIRTLGWSAVFALNLLTPS
jgi:hypothetical protein